MDLGCIHPGSIDLLCIYILEAWTLGVYRFVPRISDLGMHLCTGGLEIGIQTLGVYASGAPILDLGAH